MLKNKGLSQSKAYYVLLLLVVLCWASAVRGEPAFRRGWRGQQVDWRLSGGRRAKAVYCPDDKPLPTLAEHRKRPSRAPRKELRYPEPSAQLEVYGQVLTEPIVALVFDSPPVAGFVPWIVVSVTDAMEGWDFNAYPSDEVVGRYLAQNPESDYAFGIFDTGAGTNLISDDDAFKTGIYGENPENDLVTSLVVELQGATGTAIAYTSKPLGIFIGGLDIRDSNGLLLDDSEMLGEYNVSVVVGDPDSSPNLPTAIGAPMAAYLNAAFCNNKQLSVTIDGNDFNCPYISFYSLYDSSVPSYSNRIGLELRPSDAAAVQYFPCELLSLCGSEPSGTPAYPSMIWGLLSYQSLYFLPRVDLANDDNSAPFNDKFMFDTGAQITVISETMAAGLRLDTNNPDFMVEIQDVTGQTTIEPGFYIDSLKIPATGQWLEYENVPVVMLDVQSPEGGLLDGIIGMNLFVDLNFVFKGGGLAGQGYYPKIEFEPVCDVPGDIAPACGDCKVDYSDLGELCEHWLQTSASPGWNSAADLAPPASPDEKIDLLDYAALAEHWLEQGL